MKPHQTLDFDGFQVGALAAALLLSYGIRMLVLAANPALSHFLIDAMHYVIRQGGFRIRLNTARITLSWMEAASYAFPGVISLFLGLRLGAFVTRNTREKYPTPHP